MKEEQTVDQGTNVAQVASHYLSQITYEIKGINLMDVIFN
jgi:hypothetical protein